MSAEEDLQREITRAALRALHGTGFALAGSGAIREYGLVDRPTRHVDLVTSDPDVAAFDSAVKNLVDVLRQGAGGRRIRRLGGSGTMAFWGALLGTGALTIVPHAIVLLMPAIAVAAGSPLPRAHRC